MKKLLVLCGLCAISQSNTMGTGNNEIETRLKYIRLMQTLAQTNLNDTDTSKKVLFSLAIKTSTLTSVSAGSDETDWPIYKSVHIPSYEVLTNPTLLKNIQKLFEEEAQKELVTLQEQIYLLKK